MQAAAASEPSLVTLINYVLQDMVDLNFLAKGPSQTMSRPMAGDDQGAKRVARFWALVWAHLPLQMAEPSPEVVAL